MAQLLLTNVGSRSYTLPSGRYTIECWGAGVYNGGIMSSNQCGFSKGIYDFPNNTKITCVVGGRGTEGTAGYNGGGSSVGSTIGTGGGGATHVFYNSTGISQVEINNSQVRENILLVAGGHGGISGGSIAGGDGGGTSGADASGGTRGGKGGTQTSGGAGGSGGLLGTAGSTGTAGLGGAAATTGGTFNGGGGGGGWFGGGGGGANSGISGGGGGGSGYINTSAPNFVSGSTHQFVSGWNSSNPALGNQKQLGTGNYNGAIRITSDALKCTYNDNIVNSIIFNGNPITELRYGDNKIL